MNIKTIIPVFITIILTSYAQLIIKWQVVKMGHVPLTLQDKIYFLIKIIINPWVISGFIAIFIGAICWLLAMSKLQLSYIYPFIGLTIVMVMMASAFLFKENVSTIQIFGSTLVILGLIVIGYGHINPQGNKEGHLSSVPATAKKA